MMGAGVALLAAAVYGAGDFLGGLAVRRLHAFTVVAIGQVVGLLLMLVAAPTLGAGEVRIADLAWGAAAGLSTLIGIPLLYLALALGRMSVVAPVTALFSVAVPVVWGLIFAAWPSPIVAAGLALAALAILAVSRESDRGPAPANARAAFWIAIAAGLGIGWFYVLIAHTEPAAGLWPLVAARSASVALVLLAIPLVLRRGWVRRPTGAGLWMLISGAGACDAAANALYLLASREGQLAVIAMLTSLYPASTVVLAAAVLGERPNRIQAGGLALALVAVLLIVGGR